MAFLNNAKKVTNETVWTLGRRGKAIKIPKKLNYSNYTKNSIHSSISSLNTMTRLGHSAKPLSDYRRYVKRSPDTVLGELNAKARASFKPYTRNPHRSTTLGAGKKVLSGVGSVAKFPGRHKKLFVGGAIAGGVVAAHPLRNLENATGNPNYFGKIIGSAPDSTNNGSITDS